MVRNDTPARRAARLVAMMALRTFVSASVYRLQAALAPFMMALWPSMMKLNTPSTMFVTAPAAPS
ncbi:hypothetical protein, partial [Escherichia coli]|uniref:hypothetical protein n=1 Tax=Escherichia coli TaxID=562 RepID=UPI00226514D7